MGTTTKLQEDASSQELTDPAAVAVVVAAKSQATTAAMPTKPATPTPDSNTDMNSYTDNAQYLKDELYQRMQKEPQLFDWLQKSSIDGLFYWDLQQPVNEWMSPEFKKVFGYEDHEVPNTSAWWQEAMFPEDKDAALQAFAEHVGPERKPYDQVVRYRHKNGSTIWVRCRGVATMDDDGVTPVRMLGAHNDITKLMLAQEDLKRDLKLKDAALDVLTSTALDGYFDWNIKTGDEFLSDRWKRCLGYDPHEIPNRHEAYMSLLHPDDLPKATAAMQRHMDHGDAYNIILRYRRKDGSFAHMRAQGVAQKGDDDDDDDNGAWVRMFGTHTDVSDLEEARAAARSANLAKSTFLATMSHEIRTPLNAVLGMAQSLMTSSLTEEQLDDLNTLRNSGSHLLSLINDLLDFSQIEAGHIGISSEEFSIEESIVSVLDSALSAAEKKGVDLLYDSRIPIDAVFTGDSDRIRQIAFNLIGNAVKFTSEGAVQLMLVGKTVEGVMGVEMTVQDSGIGMSPEAQVRVFEEFTQANLQTRRLYGGSGLGLSICKKLVGAMNGYIKVDSTLGVGSTFTVWLPGLNIEGKKQSTGEGIAYKSPIHVYEGNIGCQMLADRAAFVTGNGCCTRHTDEVSIVEAIEQSRSVMTVLLGPGVSTTRHKRVLSSVLGADSSKVKIVAVGKALRSLGTQIVKDRCTTLPLFATNKQLMSALCGTWRSRMNRSITFDKDTSPLLVMVAEDNIVNQKVIKRLLSRFPCNVLIAGNGDEAVQMEKQHKFDVIFMDCFMPIKDGYEATTYIRKTNKTIPIVALTANASTQDRDACFQSGMSGYLTKPVNVDELAQVIYSAVESRNKQCSDGTTVTTPKPITTSLSTCNGTTTNNSENPGTTIIL